MKRRSRRHAGAPRRGRRRGGEGRRRPARDGGDAARRLRARRSRAARGRRPAWPRRCSPTRSPGRSASSSGASSSRPTCSPPTSPATSRCAAASWRFRPRPGVHQRAARRRDQPHAAEDPGRAARGDAGAPGVGRRPPGAAARPVPRRRDAEPDRVRGHLRAARGAARPLPRQARRRLPVGGRGARDARAARAAGVGAGASTRSGRSRARTRCARRAREVDATRVEQEVARYVVDVVRRTRELPSVELGA